MVNRFLHLILEYCSVPVSPQYPLNLAAPNVSSNNLKPLPPIFLALSTAHSPYSQPQPTGQVSPSQVHGQPRPTESKTARPSRLPSRSPARLYGSSPWGQPSNRLPAPLGVWGEPGARRLSTFCWRFPGARYVSSCNEKHKHGLEWARSCIFVSLRSSPFPPLVFVFWLLSYCLGLYTLHSFRHSNPLCWRVDDRVSCLPRAIVYKSPLFPTWRLFLPCQGLRQWEHATE